MNKSSFLKYSLALRTTALVFAAVAVSAQAQTASAPAGSDSLRLTPALPQNLRTAPEQPAAQRTQVNADVNGLIEFAESILAMIDAGQAASVYQSASTELKKVQTEASFTQNIQNSRQPLGALTLRQWQSSSLVAIRPPQSPSGEYMNMVFTSTLAQGRVVQELVSVRVDEDRNWRFMGYSLNTLAPPTGR